MKSHFVSSSTRVAALLAVACFSTAGLGAQELVGLSQPAAQDLVSSAARSLEGFRFSLPGVSREPVSFTYALGADHALGLEPPHQAASREYWVEVDGRQLRQGVTLYTTAPGALVRINPAGAAQLAGKANQMAIDPMALELRKNGQRFVGGQGMELLATAEQLRAADAPFLEGTSAFRVAETLGAGALQLALPTQLADSDRFVVHVFEPKSPIALRLQAAKSDLLDGQQLEVAATLGEGLGMSKIEAMVTSPAGRAWPLRFVATGNGGYRGQLKVDALAGAGQGLWEVQLVGRGQVNGNTVVRGARTAFSVAAPTAAVAGPVTLDRQDGLRLAIPVQVAVEGRYEVRGVLYGTQADGQSRPLAMGHFANWLGAGEGRLTLTFDRALLDASGLQAPYTLRDLRLVDQSRMGLLHRQDQALAIP